MKAEMPAKIRVKIGHLINPDKPCLKPPITKPQSLLVVLVPLVYAKEAGWSHEFLEFSHDFTHRLSQ